MFEHGLSYAERVDLIRGLEDLKAAAAAAQARAAAALDASQRAGHAALGLPAKEQGRGVAAQVALARRESPTRGAQHLGLAKVLVAEMPHTLAALTAGRLSEWRATLLVRGTACLSLEHRQVVDRVLVADPARLEGLGDRAVAAQAKKLAYRLDPYAAVRRARRAESERSVTCRPAPDTMAYLTALLPVQQAVAAYAALTRAAETARAAGDPRGRGQVMADTLVERLTGQATADAVPVEVHLVISDDTLLGGPDGQSSHESANLIGYGPVPAPLARSWVRGQTEDQSEAQSAAEMWLRRLYTRPGTGDLVAMDSRRRRFDGSLRRLVVARDHTCRTPWCDAPIRHLDHVTPLVEGGATSAVNGQGLCERCNHTKTAPGWAAHPRLGPRHTVDTTSPTGHTYTSTARPLRDPPARARPRQSMMEQHFAALLAA